MIELQYGIAVNHFQGSVFGNIPIMVQVYKFGADLELLRFNCVILIKNESLRMATCVT